jgi:hypothetical protein
MANVALMVLVETQRYFYCHRLIMQALGFGKPVVDQLRGCFFE